MMNKMDEDKRSKGMLSDSDIVQVVDKWVDKVCKSGGRGWSLRVPVDFNHDPYVLITDLTKRFTAQAMKIEELEEQVEDTENALTGAITCIESMKCCGNCAARTLGSFDCGSQNILCTYWSPNE